MLRWVGMTILLVALGGCQAPGTSTRPLSGARAERHDEDALAAGHLLMAAGDFEGALGSYTRAAAQDGLTADVLSAMGSANLKLGRLGQARTLLENAVEKDPKFVPAWNNLGVVLMEMGETAEAGRVFRNAYALDDGNSDQIRENLRLAIAKSENPSYAPAKEEKFELVRRGKGNYLLLKTPESDMEQ
ncbi:MAG: tetratricopeptide repeat protein [Rhodobacteraceae bacterium]|nr:tetratricopeptide repeat protein [Paracoccaceae bacterium]